MVTLVISFQDPRNGYHGYLRLSMVTLAITLQHSGYHGYRQFYMDIKVFSWLLYLKHFNILELANMVTKDVY